MQAVYKNCRALRNATRSATKSTGGTEADGSRSRMYCGRSSFLRGAWCYRKSPLEQMQRRARDKLADLHIPGFLAGFLTRGILKLERWRSRDTLNAPARIEMFIHERRLRAGSESRGGTAESP